MKLTTLGFSLILVIALAALARFAGGTTKAAPPQVVPTTPSVIINK